MAILRCPHCKLPLVDDEARGATCPICKSSLKEGAPVAATAAAPPVVAPPRRSAFGLVCGVSLALLSAAILYLAVQPWDPFAANEPEVTTKQDGRAREVLPLPGSAAEAAPAPAPAPPNVEPAGGQAKQAPEPRPEPKKPAPPLANPAGLAADVVWLQGLDGEYAVGALTNGKGLKLSGRIKTLRVAQVDSGASLDASKLEAQEIIFTGRIDGGATVRLNAPGGKVEFRARVDGHSTLEVNAPRGTVAFTAPAERGRPGSTIDGDARVTITAKAVTFQGTINGTKTRVEVTLSRGGSLQCSQLAGAIRLHYRKADRADPEPTVRCGGISGIAELKRVD